MSNANDGCLQRLVLRHITLDGRFRIKRNPARKSLVGMALVEKEYAPEKWREYGIVGADEFFPENNNLSGGR